MSWTTDITVKNKTGATFRFKIRKGQIFENKQVGTGLQNVAAARDYVFDLPAGSTGVFQIEVLCINQKLSPPRGALNLTNFMVGKNFQSQQDLWNIMNSK